MQKVKTSIQKGEITSKVFDPIHTDANTLLQNAYTQFINTSKDYKFGPDSRTVEEEMAKLHFKSFNGRLLLDHPMLLEIFVQYCKKRLCIDTFEFYSTAFNFTNSLFLDHEALKTTAHGICVHWLGFDENPSKVVFDNHKWLIEQLQQVTKNNTYNYRMFVPFMEAAEQELESHYVDLLTTHNIKALDESTLKKLKKQLNL